MSYDVDANFITDTISKIIKHESLLVGNSEYCDVYEKSFAYDYIDADTTLLHPVLMYYTKGQGLLQLKMSNNETYTIKN